MKRLLPIALVLAGAALCVAAIMPAPAMADDGELVGPRLFAACRDTPPRLMVQELYEKCALVSLTLSGAFETLRHRQS
jgi:hypothetical protein